VNDKSRHICPVEFAGSLDNRIRRWLQNPKKILGTYVKEGMTVLDLGCGPGFFTVELAGMVGKSGRVIAADLQEGMLAKLDKKIRGTEIAERIKLHQCADNKIGVAENADFVLSFYMVHEVPHQEAFFKEIYSILKPNGQFLIVEPKLFHVSKKAFALTVMKAEAAGFKPVAQPHVLLSRSILLKKS
jgi:ubiquinone/menaquinone biosynthesis C-methylase UbiE